MQVSKGNNETRRVSMRGSRLTPSIKHRVQFSTDGLKKKHKTSKHSTVRSQSICADTVFLHCVSVITYVELIRRTSWANASSSTLCISSGAYLTPRNALNWRCQPVLNCGVSVIWIWHSDHMFQGRDIYCCRWRCCWPSEGPYEMLCR